MRAAKVKPTPTWREILRDLREADPGIAAKFRVLRRWAGCFAEGWAEAFWWYSWKLRGIRPGIIHRDPQTGERTVVKPTTRRNGTEYFDSTTGKWRPSHEYIS